MAKKESLHLLGGVTPDSETLDSAKDRLWGVESKWNPCRVRGAQRVGGGRHPCSYLPPVGGIDQDFLRDGEAFFSVAINLWAETGVAGLGPNTMSFGLILRP